MTLDDIIRMARKAGYGDAMSELHAPALERFAALVAAAERDACARLIEDYERFGDTRDCIAAIRARCEKGDV